MSRTFDRTTPAWLERSFRSLSSAGERNSPEGFATAYRAQQLVVVPDRNGAIRAVQPEGPLGVQRDRGPILAVRGPRPSHDELVADPEPHLSALGSRTLGDHAGGPRQDVLGGVRARDALAEPRQDLVGRGPLAIDEPVRDALHPFAHRLEREGDDRGRDDRQAQALVRGADQAPQHDHDRDVDQRDEPGERHVHDRPVDHHVDVVEAVLEVAIPTETGSATSARAPRTCHQNPALGTRVDGMKTTSTRSAA